MLSLARVYGVTHKPIQRNALQLRPSAKMARGIYNARVCAPAFNASATSAVTRPGGPDGHVVAMVVGEILTTFSACPVRV
jgi:hypothetical protein